MYKDMQTYLYASAGLSKASCVLEYLAYCLTRHTDQLYVYIRPCGPHVPLWAKTLWALLGPCGPGPWALPR